MKLPIEWLNEYVKVDDIPVNELANTLLSIGFEVEEIIYEGDGIENIVIGKIISLKKHPNADKLQICAVDVGGKTLQIVTGASNVFKGAMIPVAMDGAVLPDGKTIKTGELRGVLSEGMLCGGSELGVDNAVIDGAEVDGILILPKNAPVGEDIKKYLGLDGYILDVSITANRPDCQSIYGMAREVATMLGRKLKPLDLKFAAKPASMKIPGVKIENYALCSRYTGRLIENVSVAPSPIWMKRRLNRMGLRPINNIVDITNYVLLEVGQPLHAFDLRQLSGDICVRNAATNEKITALDDNEYALTSEMLVIADSKKPLAIAGVMGGENSGIENDTANVFLESARFARGSIRGTSRKLGLRSDSSARFEKGVDWQSADVGSLRALSLIAKLKAGTVTEAISLDQIDVPQNKVISTSVSQICKLLGIEIEKQAIVSILKGLGIKVSFSGKEMNAEIPAFREDIDNYTDLAEEVIRYYGYDNISSEFMKTSRPTEGGITVSQQNIAEIKKLMCAFGAYEILTYSFINKNVFDLLNIPKGSTYRNYIEVSNPLSEEFAVMRTLMAGGLLGAVRSNTKRNNVSYRLFEQARVYIADKLPLEELPEERETLSVAFVGENESFYTLKEVATEIAERYSLEIKTVKSAESFLHPGMSADIVLNGQKIGYMGKVHPKVCGNFEIPEDVYILEMNLSGFVYEQKPQKRYVPLPKYPSSNRDLAVVVKESYTIGELTEEMKLLGGENCESVELFDIYRGEQIPANHKSVAFSLKFRSKERTLGDDEVNSSVEKILSGLKSKFGAELR